MKIFNGICNFFSTLIVIAFALIAAVLVGPMLFGCKNMAVLSGSMEPKIPVGSVVCVKEINPEELMSGDIITYAINGGTMVTHRVVAVNQDEQTVITKGDANDVEDGNPVAFSQVVGKEVFHIPYLGYLSIYIKTPLGVMVVCGILIVLILLNFLPSVLAKEEK